MKASELRLENLVFQHGEPVEIYQLDRGGHTFWQINDMRIHKETGREQNTHELILQPIPLTEEWLVKFGFKKKVDYEQSEDEWGIISSINSRRGVGLYQPDEYKDKCPNYFFVTFREDVGCGWSDLNEVEYVHQLQNLYFSLTGEELTII